MNAASQVPSVVLISTLVSTTPPCAAASVPSAAAIPAPTVIVTKSRRVISSSSISHPPAPESIPPEILVRRAQLKYSDGHESAREGRSRDGSHQRRGPRR